MPLFYQQTINATTQLAIWKIAEPESFFLAKVPLQNTITHPLKRLQHLAGRYLLQHMFPDFPYHEIVIASTRKPFLPYEQYHFSISHCGNFAAAIVSQNNRVGIDIEIATTKVLRVAAKFLNNAEQTFFLPPPLPSATNVQLITLLWSVKEAVFKWWGRGEIDFSDAIQIAPFQLQTMGTINVLFVKEEASVELPLQYLLFEEICLAWVASATEDLFM